MELAILEGESNRMQNLYSGYAKLSPDEKAELLGFSFGKSMRRLGSAVKPTNVIKFAARQTQRVNPLHYIPGTRGSFLDPSGARVGKQFQFGARMLRKTGNAVSTVAPVAKYIPVVGTAVMAIDDANKARQSFIGGFQNIQGSLFDKVKDVAPDLANMVANADIQKTAQNMIENEESTKIGLGPQSGWFKRLKETAQNSQPAPPPGFVEDAENAVQKVIDKINLPALKTETSLNLSNIKTPLLLGGAALVLFLALKKK